MLNITYGNEWWGLSLERAGGLSQAGIGFWRWGGVKFGAIRTSEPEHTPPKYVKTLIIKLMQLNIIQVIRFLFKKALNLLNLAHPHLSKM